MRYSTLVKSDMHNGLESVSCLIAKNFYENCREHLIGCTDRDSVERLYNSTFKYWIKPEIKKKQYFRNFNQVLYALVNDGAVCKVIRNPCNGKHDIIWKN
jgi:hypothetical protein